jgi:hypothetical protein
MPVKVIESIKEIIYSSPTPVVVKEETRVEVFESEIGFLLAKHLREQAKICPELVPTLGIFSDTGVVFDVLSNCWKAMSCSVLQ